MISSSIHAEIPQNLPEELSNRVPSFHGHFVEAVLLPEGLHLGAPKPGVWVHVERGECVGDRCLGDVRGTGVYWSLAHSRFHPASRLRIDRNSRRRFALVLG